MRVFLTLICFVPLHCDNINEPIFSVIHIGLKYICQICRFHPWIWFGAFSWCGWRTNPVKDSCLLPDFWILLSLPVAVGWFACSKLDQLCSYSGWGSTRPLLLLLPTNLVDYICTTVPSVLGAPSQAICHPSTRDTSLRLTEGPVIFGFYSLDKYSLQFGQIHFAIRTSICWLLTSHYI